MCRQPVGGRAVPAKEVEVNAARIVELDSFHLKARPLHVGGGAARGMLIVPWLLMTRCQGTSLPAGTWRIALPTQRARSRSY